MLRIQRRRRISSRTQYHGQLLQKKKLAETVYEARKKIIAGLSNVPLPFTQEAHDLVFNVLSEEKDNLGGESSIYLLPGLFILTETHIMEGRAKKAEEYLTAAYWNFLKYTKFDDKT